MTKNQSIPRRNSVNWHYARDDYIFTMIKVVSRHEDTQLYGAILPNELTNDDIKNSESYKEYYAIASGAEPPKTKASVKKKQIGSDKTMTSSTTKGKRLKTSAKTAKHAKKKQPAKTSIDKGFIVLSEVALIEAEKLKLVIERSKTQTHISCASGSGADEGTSSLRGVPGVPTYDSDDEQISWKSRKEENDDVVNVSEDDDTDDDDNQDDNDDGHDDQDADATDDQDKDDQDAENPDDDNEQTDSDNNVQTPSHVESTDDEDDDEEIQGVNIEGEEMDEDSNNEESERNELYRDLNVNLEGRDVELTDAQPTNVITTQVIEDTYVIITPVIPEDQQQSSSISSVFVSNMLTIDQHTVVSSILGIVDAYLANKRNEVIKTAVQLQSNRPIDESQAKNEDFLNKHDDNIKKIIKNHVKEQVKAQVSKILPKIKKTVNEQLEAKIMTRSSTKSKTSLAIAANLSELELKKILIEKMESNKLINRCKDDEDRDDEEKMESNNRKDDEDKDEETSAGSTWGYQRKRHPRLLASQLMGPTLNTKQTNEETSQHPDWFQKPAKLPTPNHDWNKSLPAVHGPVQPWLSNLAREEGPRKSFDELMDTPLYFLAVMINCLKIDTLKPELLVGPTLELMKGQQYPHDLRKPLPLIPNSRGRQVIPFDHFINNNLAYLPGGVSSRTYATSITKTKAADYGHIKWIKDLVPNTMWSEVPVNYDKHALWGISDWGRKRQQFYAFVANRESTRDITVRRDDDKLYTFKEGDFKRLRLQDIEDMLILFAQGKLTNLNVEDRPAFGVSLRMFTRSIVIQRCVEDLQLGVESYQKKLNITKPDTYRSDLKCRDAYTTYSNPRGFIYQNKDKKNKLMRIDELHKFSDSTLDVVRTTLNDHLKGIRMEYLPQTIWRQSDRERAKAMIQAIDKQLKSRRIMRSLERFVGGRPYGGDLRLLQRTI
ncbi:hypothetical protein Tco_1153363 [Tanacetum coccineum]